jgi:pimeloyl-ACP methyl ester carboxylesterase
MATFLDRAVVRVVRALGIEQRFVPTSVADHHVYDTGGSAPTLVCLPGLSDTATSWVPVMLALRRRGYRVVIIEGAGHGLSTQPREHYAIESHFATITEVLDKLVAEPAVLVGNSLGGATALHYATVRPESVRALFLASPAGGLVDEVSIARMRAAFELTSLADATAFLERVLHRPTPLHRLMARAVLASNASRAVGELVRSIRAEHVIDGVSSIAVPIHVLWGRSERLLPQVSLDWLRENLPTHAIVAHPDGFGHCPHLDNPFRFARMIDRFVAET